MKKLLIILLLASPCYADNVLLNNNGDTTAYMILGRDTVKAINMIGSYANIRFANGTKYFLNRDSTFGGTASSIDWTAVLNKPLTFTPSTHTHDYAPSAHTTTADAHLPSQAGQSGGEEYENSKDLRQTKITNKQ
jgi:hypothetical protein